MKNPNHGAAAVALAMLCLALSACGAFRGNGGVDPIMTQAQPTEIATITGHTTMPGAFAQVDLATLLYESVHGEPGAKAGQAMPSAPDGNTASFRIEAARRYFYENCPSANLCKVLRNRVQDRLLAASAQACANYKEAMRESFNKTNLGLGVVTTALAGVATIFTNPDAARLFSGGATIASGSRAEYNQVLFSSITLDVIFDGVDLARDEFYGKILRTRRGPDGEFSEYNLDRAMRDAVEYHQMCAVPVGVRRAGGALRNDRDPGLKRMGELLEQNGITANLALGAASVDADSIRPSQRECPALADALGLLASRLTTVTASAVVSLPAGASSTGPATATLADNPVAMGQIARAGDSRVAGSRTYAAICLGAAPAASKAVQADIAVTEALTAYLATTDLSQRPALAAKFRGAQQSAESLRLQLIDAKRQVDASLAELNGWRAALVTRAP